MIAGEILVALVVTAMFWAALFVVGWIGVLVLEQSIYFCQVVADIYRGGRNWIHLNRKARQ
jgi:hypothetical protein